MNTTGFVEFLMLVLFLVTLVIVITRKTNGKDKLIWFTLAFIFPFVGFIVFYYFRIKGQRQ